MFLLNMVNIAVGVYIIIALYQLYMYNDNMCGGALHHFYSHIFLVVFVAVGINSFILKGYETPLVLAILYVLQHVGKENMRLVKTSRWNRSVDRGD